jgi:hypothetical protein
MRLTMLKSPPSGKWIGEDLTVWIKMPVVRPNQIPWVEETEQGKLRELADAS